MKKVIFNFEKLIVYQKSLDFMDLVYEITRSFPKDELYNLTSQFKRASLSICLNISEGHGDTDKQFNRYLKMAWDSVKECVTCSTAARRQGYISEEMDNTLRLNLEELSKMIAGLRKKLKTK
ncbi:four helix bundle protein [Rasiella sp. SM2506]|uniref:four helix bundle protein n=1 Tax=Rasiella sp. SM2506 TaxID=3423914 RepID=UPI003D7B7971